MTIFIQLLRETCAAPPASAAGRPPRPKYLTIADAIETAAARGLLQPGVALPTHREVADVLGVTVGTVTRGYAEAARRGLVRGETGRGTFPLSQKEGFARIGRRAEDTADFLREAGTLHEPHDAEAHPLQQQSQNGFSRVDMGLNTPFHALDPDLGEALGQLAARGNLQPLLHYHQPRGLLRHREAGVHWAALHGYRAEPDNVLVCAGAQHGMAVTLSALFAPGDRIAVESLTYPLIKPLAKRLRLQLVPVAMDAQGMLPEAFAAACVQDNVRGLYIMPGCQNPTLAHMPEYRRHEMAALCRRHGVRIIEDDMYALTLETVLPPISALAPELGCFIASTSKALTGGLRTAFVCAPPDCVRRLESAIESTIWMSAPLMAELAVLWLQNGTAARVLHTKRAEAAARNAMTRDILGAWNYSGRPSGYYIWLRLPKRWRSVEFSEAAAQRGVSVAHMEHFAVGSAQPEQGVRVSLCGPRDRQNLRTGLEVLADLLSL
ncbi:aminotransferase-like domain-containing protein [Desulfovibrio psychrotolerans]|uniref:Transcriptional regulator n=1 Tax=Desulfovibrio psychrotolerans TaxID=415242 RepID=A0A7J0BXP7_9BACT|nr:PLP-dependent aminotransferase family protein [Desulfovibrio psychrotolerans]GFM37774.1 transcriptional regulator [Desulfovibrio psychrotolerans]